MHWLNPSLSFGSTVTRTSAVGSPVSTGILVTSVVTTTWPPLATEGQVTNWVMAKDSPRSQLVVLLEKALSPVRFNHLFVLLVGYLNNVDTKFLLAGFTNGFRIPYKPVRAYCMAHNLKSIKEMEAVVLQKIQELKEGRVPGSF